MAEVIALARAVRRRVAAAVGSRRFRVWARPLVGAIVLAAVAWRVGATPFVHGLLGVDVRTAVIAVVLCAVSTASSAWRWRVVANRLGVRVAFAHAVGMYYRSQFLNIVLPGGVLGDVHRAVVHGADSGKLAQASRAVAIERAAGQVVQSMLAVVVLVWAGAEFAGWALVALGIAFGVLVTIVAIVSASVRLRRVLVRELAELRTGVGSPAAALQVTAASVIAVACHVVLFAVAVSAVGGQVPPLRLAALALVVLLGASIPLNVGGWGPREGVAGWVFATAGSGSAVGVAASTAFGLLAMIAVASGAVVSAACMARPKGARTGSEHAALIPSSGHRGGPAS